MEQQKLERFISEEVSKMEEKIKNLDSGAISIAKLKKFISEEEMSF